MGQKECRDQMDDIITGQKKLDTHDKSRKILEENYTQHCVAKR